ncbi:MAG: aminomethyl-transferring glycine dehydrogenase subunit GcvPA [Trueperaceae bacterium]
MNYTPHTEEDVTRALAAIGARSVDDLFSAIPVELLDPPIDLPSGMDEVSLLARMRQLAEANARSSTLMGGGLAKHFIPSVVQHLTMQSEFVTAYTPYQPEVSQGILQATFEYQTMMSELTELPVSNASMYDGASAVAEAALVAVRHTGRERVLVSAGVHPETREVLATYLGPLDIELTTVALDDRLSTPRLQVGNDVAAVLVQQPNFLGYLEDMEPLAEAAHAAGALFVSVVDPLSLGLLRPPGSYGADVAVGDGQTIGNPLYFGGPHFGFMVVTEQLLRQLPGRIVGQTVDVDGRRAFVLTLQAREQHIRRARAKSNICSNHQLTALMATVNLAALGPEGLCEAATGSVAAAHQLADDLAGEGYRVRREANFFNEFVIELDTVESDKDALDPVELYSASRAAASALAARGVQAGIPVPSEYGLNRPALLLCATELTSAEERRRLVRAMSEVVPVSAGTGGRR